MSEQLYYEDVNEGDEVTPLTKRPTTEQLVRWAGASGDYNPIHYDKDFATQQGLPGVIVHGQLAGAFLGQMLSDWISVGGFLKKLSLSYKGMNLPGEELTCHGKVTRKYEEDHWKLVDLRIWIQNPQGEKTLTGSAVVILPTRY